MKKEKHITPTLDQLVSRFQPLALNERDDNV
jgi:hypothetical protein